MSTQKSDRQLAALNHAAQALEEAKSIDDIKEIRDKAEAVRVYAKAAHAGLELQNTAAEIKLRAERKAGEYIAGLRLHGGDHCSESCVPKPKLTELGVTKVQSHRWQLLAVVPEKSFCKYLADANKLGEEIAAAPLLKVARHLKGGAAPAKPRGAASRNGSHRKPSNEASEAARAPDDVLREMANHCRTLVSLLGTTLDSPPPKLTAGDIRYVRRTVLELTTLLEAMNSR